MVVGPGQSRVARVADPQVEDAVHHEQAAGLLAPGTVASLLEGRRAHVDAGEGLRAALDPGEPEAQFLGHLGLEAGAVAIGGVEVAVVGPGRGPDVGIPAARTIVSQGAQVMLRITRLGGYGDVTASMSGSNRTLALPSWYKAKTSDGSADLGGGTSVSPLRTMIRSRLGTTSSTWSPAPAPHTASLGTPGYRPAALVHQPMPQSPGRPALVVTWRTASSLRMRLPSHSPLRRINRPIRARARAV